MYQTSFTIEPYGPILNGPGALKKSIPFSLKKLSSIEQESIEKAKKYAKDQSIRVVLLKQSKQHEILQQTNMKRNQAMILLSRIYVGSINYDVREDAIKAAFRIYGPVKSVSLSYDPITQKHMGYSFVEYEYPEAAQLSISGGNGVTIAGRQVKVGRPTNMPHTGPMVEELLAEARRYHRIYIASVHADLSETDLKSLFESFGNIQYCSLDPDSSRPGKHRGFGFIEYETAQAANDAVASMNMFNLGGLYLRVCHAITPPNTTVFQAAPILSAMPAAAAIALASITAQVQEIEVNQITKTETHVKKPRARFSETSSSSSIIVPPPSFVMPVDNIIQIKLEATKPTNIDIPLANTANVDSLDKENVHIRGREARNQMMQKLMRTKLQRVVVLKNMVGPEDADDQLQEEVFEECTKYGEVENVKIFVESLEDVEEGEETALVKVFVLFVVPESVEAAIASINGRTFAGRLVTAEKYDQDLYDAGDFSG